MNKFHIGQIAGFLITFRPPVHFPRGKVRVAGIWPNKVRIGGFRA